LTASTAYLANGAAAGAGPSGRQRVPLTQRNSTSISCSGRCQARPRPYPRQRRIHRHLRDPVSLTTARSSARPYCRVSDEIITFTVPSASAMTRSALSS
jgi:hypothetical protein